MLDTLALPALTNKSHTDHAQLAREIAEARSLGFAVGHEEYVEGVSGVAVPVLFDAGRPQAADAIVTTCLHLLRRCTEE